jgi:hypothetical protein
MRSEDMLGYICLIPLAILFILFLLVRFLLSSRYQRSIAKKIVIGAFIVSILVSGAYYIYALDDFHKNETDYINPAIDWQKMEAINTSSNYLEYRPDVGLFATTDAEEIQVTKSAPLCSVENQAIEILPESIEIVDSPYEKLPDPPNPSKQQITFKIQYSVEYDTDAYSSFAIMENGELWCTERVFRGPADFPNVAAYGLGIVITAFFIFIGGMFLILLLGIIGLEFHRWQNTSKKNAD